MTEQVMETIKITDHPTHGEFNVEVPEGMDDSAVNQYVSNLNLNLLLGAGRSKMKGEEVKQIKQFENSNKAGFKNDRWTPVPSLEGGTDTIAYGHKLTPKEVQSGIIKIGDTEVKYADGLTEEQAVALFTQDGEWAKGIAEDSLGKSGLELTPNRVEALTSLIYNVGSGSWGKSKAKQYLESGYIEDFMHEAFDPEVGFVKINGEVSRGLVRRRNEEARLFGESDIAQGGSFGTMISEVLSKFNPISEAAAGTLPPTAEATPQTLLKRNSKDTESVGKLQDMLGMDVGEDRGIFGPATEAAVKAFQKEQGLTVDGIVGKDTFAALESSESEGESIFSRLNPFSSAEAGEAQAALPPPSKVNGSPLTEDDQGYWDILTSTPALAGVADVLIRSLPEFMQQPVWNENILSPNTFKFLKKHASESISKGKLFLDYNTDKEGVKSVSHKAGIPDLRKPSNELKFLLGKGTYVKYNNIVYLADEYDYNYNLELRDQSIFSKLSQVYDRAQEYKEGKVGKFAVIDSVLERFQAKPGEGVSIRMKLGTPKELGLSQEDFDRLPTFENYESKQTIKKENIGWRPDNGKA